MLIGNAKRSIALCTNSLSIANEIKRSLILKLSRERIWNELKLILSSHSVTTAMFLMDQTGVLPILFPNANLDELKKMSNLEKLLEEIVQDSDKLKNLIFCQKQCYFDILTLRGLKGLPKSERFEINVWNTIQLQLRKNQ